LPEKQPQSNLIRLLKNMVHKNRIRTNWEWVKGHAVKSRGWQNCTLSEKLNYYADDLAKRALLAAVNGGEVITVNFPLELVQYTLAGVRVTGSPRSALGRHWGYEVAQDLFDTKQIIHASNFDLVWWDGIRAAMQDYPKMYQVWVTKQFSKFCGTKCTIVPLDLRQAQPKV
jgi:hypothetical protein